MLLEWLILILGLIPKQTWVWLWTAEHANCLEGLNEALHHAMENDSRFIFLRRYLIRMGGF